MLRLVCLAVATATPLIRQDQRLEILPSGEVQPEAASFAVQEGLTSSDDADITGSVQKADSHPEWNFAVKVHLPDGCKRHFSEELVMMTQNAHSMRSHFATSVPFVCPDSETPMLQMHRESSGNEQCEKSEVESSSGKVCKYNMIAELFRLGPGMEVLDWGAGCGHYIENAARIRRFKPIGLDIVADNVKWGKTNLMYMHEFCMADGQDLSFISSNSVDAIMSNSALKSLKKNQQCELMKNHVFRVLRAGGCAWFGGLGVEGWKLDGFRSEEAVPQGFWADTCLKDLKQIVSLQTLSEKDLFGLEGEAYSLIACKMGNATG